MIGRAKNVWFLGDVNGDRYADLIEFYQGPGTNEGIVEVVTNASNGQQFQTLAAWRNLGPHWRDTHAWLAEDVTGAGKTDLIQLRQQDTEEIKQLRTRLAVPDKTVWNS